MCKKSKGFTLVELLLVIGIIATLAVVVFVALDPAKRFQDARNARRVSDVETILSAAHQYIIDNKGALPPGLTNYMQQIGDSNYGCEPSNLNSGKWCGGDTATCLPMGELNSLGHYLKTLPFDPSAEASAARTHYTIVVDDRGIITVTACDAEGDMGISVSR